MDKEESGVLWAISAYMIWGILPIYWKILDDVPNAEILISRVI